MNPFRLKNVLTILTLGVALAAQAQNRPPLHILVGFAPGGSTDTVARIIGEKLRGPLGQSVIVENKPGAGGRLAAEALKNSAPDGQTYMLAPNATGVFQSFAVPRVGAALRPVDRPCAGRGGGFVSARARGRH